MIVAVDVGTSSVKVGLVNQSGRIVRSYVKAIPLSTPVRLAAEHDLEILWRLVLEGIVRVSRGYENKVEAVSLGTYLHALGVLEERFRVVVNAMTYLDRRCHEEQKEIEKYGIELYRRTGCPPIFVFPLCKALWLRRQGLLKSSHKLTFLKDYLAYKLTGSHVIDYGVASGTGFLNVHDLRWEPLALEVSMVDENMLPQLVEGARIYDYVDIRDAGLTSVAVVLGSFDGALQNIGYGVFKPDAVLNLGSTTVVRMLTPITAIDKKPEARFFTYYAADGYRVVGGASNNGMLVVEWFKKVFRRRYSLHEGILCDDGVYVLPFVAGERYPFRDPGLTFTVTGLRLEHGYGDLVKALFEGMALVARAIVEAIEENGIEVRQLHCAGGGCGNSGLVSVFANVLCKPVLIHKDPKNAVLLGAAVTAMKALGYIKSFSEVEFRSTTPVACINPDSDSCTTYEECLKKFLKLVNVLRMLP